MPKMDGRETAMAPRSLGMTDTPCLIMVMAHGREEVGKAAGRAGVSDVLVKPVQPSAMLCGHPCDGDEPPTGPREARLRSCDTIR